MTFLLFRLRKRIGDLLAAIRRRDEHDERAASNNQAQRTGCLVAFVIWGKALAGTKHQKKHQEE